MVSKRWRRFQSALCGGIVLAGSTLLFPQVVSAQPEGKPAELRLATIDLQRAVVESEDGLRTQAALKKVFDERQREIEKRQNELQTERMELEKQRSTLSQEVLMQRAEKWQQDAMAAQQMFSDYQRDLQKKHNEMMQPIYAQTVRVVERIAQQEGYAMVLDKQAIAYARAELDLTDRVISAYNDAAGKSGAAKPAAGAKAAPGAKPAAKPPAGATPVPKASPAK